MATQVTTTLASGTPDAVSATLIDHVRDAFDTPPTLILVFTSVDQPLDQVLPALSQAFPQSTVLGSSTAGEFTHDQDTIGSTSLFAIHGDLQVHAGFATNLANTPYQAVQEAVADHPVEIEGYPHKTALLLIDTLSGRGEEAALLASALLEETRLVGGAAGDDKMVRTIVGLNDQVSDNALVIATLYTPHPLAIGVSHGHRPLSDTLTVTRSEGNIVHEVNDQPAWSVWVEKTRARAQEAQGFDPGNLSESGQVGAFLLSYEAGLSLGNDQFKVRAPLQRHDEAGALTFACGIPEGSVIRIMESTPADQITSARQAAQHARAELGERRAAGAVVFDCVCRKAILKDDFSKAVQAIHDELNAPLAGFETFGEIALDVGDMSGFHNTTTVVLAFPE